jgi:hypothetical protein
LLNAVTAAEDPIGKSVPYRGNPRLSLDELPLSILVIMKVLLRDARTNLYYGRDRAWVDNVERAAEFGTLEEAGGMAWECGREDTMVVLRYENPECELALNPQYCASTAGDEQQPQP